MPQHSVSCEFDTSRDSRNNREDISTSSFPLTQFSRRCSVSEAVQQQTQRILASDTFARSPRLSQLFSFIIQTSLSGNLHSLKEYTIAVDVFGRPESFDCRLDSIVRVEAARLRKKLERYYHTFGREDRLVINLPNSGYQPVVYFREDRAQLHSVVPVIALVQGKGVRSARWISHFDPTAASIVRVSRESMETFNGQYDLMVVLLGAGESGADYGWVIELGSRRASSVLFLSNLGCERSLSLVTKAIRGLAQQSQLPAPTHKTAKPSWAPASPSTISASVPIESVA